MGRIDQPGMADVDRGITSHFAQPVSLRLNPLGVRLLRHFVVDGVGKGSSKSKDGEIFIGRTHNQVRVPSYFGIGIGILLSGSVQVEYLIEEVVRILTAIYLVVMSPWILIFVPL